ncbi:fructosamine kinase family protein [Georgenia sp. EYE_87]|uniref:fructosamine kinase family protein n=1 Tax=Georgenia sp. EYE_87 TaxID=2853448 RepID=UPI0020047069|nr:fructosamine kinase family protein [Georgenia sp. EYE_87]MCK6211263.1 fructosamine kinase family protein [Georgenia sp. EYE_87]
MATHRKGDHGDPRALLYEAAGLRWLSEASAAGGAAVVEIVAEEPGVLETRSVAHGAADAASAEAFGRALALTHAAGASHHGCPPPGFTGDGFMGRAALPLRAASPSGGDSWGEFYAADRILPYLADAVANGSIDGVGPRKVERCAARVAAGVFDAPQPAAVDGVARLHGDLWSGNVLWARTDAGPVATLIDPAAQGGHAESDLAQLAVFGAPHLERIVAAYDEHSPLAEGWRERVGLHQLHMLIVHAALFGGSYGPQTVAVAARYA